MAFNINAHVILSGPKNIKAVTKSIQKQLGGLNTSINIQAPKNLTKQLGAFNKGINTLNKSIMNLQSSATSANASLKTLSNQFNNLNKSSAGMAKSQTGVQNALKTTGRNVHEVRNEIQAFGKDAALAIRRFSAFTVATGVVFGFVRAVQTATKSALDYERAITKVIQVTGAGTKEIGRLKSTIDDLSNSLGVDANELAGLARVFAQTGQSIEQVRASIRAVARSSLAPSFGEMKNTAEGLIAALAQFNIAAQDSEAVLSSINAVSKKFAVEAEDLISVVRRAGGVFSQAAGDFDDPKKSLNELIGIFTAVRSTTRESADTIAVGLRTIFTRIQRRGTIDFLRQFNIELVDARGNFVGLFPAFQKLSAGLSDIIRKGDALTLSAITEELGGVRQVGKLIPAITQFNKALEATEVAGQAAARGLGQDVALALVPLGKQFELVQTRFRTLIRDLAESKTFQNLAKVALSVANAFLSIADTLKPLLPIITTLATIKISKGLFEFGKGFVGGFNKGGGIGNVGETVGDVVTGGSGRKTAVRDTAVQQALSTALNNNTTSLKTASTALVSLNSSLSENRAVATRTTTQLLGGIGNLINALNRNAAVGSVRPKKFAKGGPVSGPSHAQGGVLAELEGGEYVIPKGYANGGKAIKITPDAIGAFFLRPPKGIDIDTAVKGQALITNQRVLERLNKGGGKGQEEARFIESIKNSTVDVQKRLFGKEAVAGGKLKDKRAIEAVLDNPLNSKRAEKARRLYRTGKNINIGDKGQKVPVKGDISGFFISARDIEKNADVAQSVTHHTTSAMESAIARAAADIRNLVGGIPPIDASEESLVKTSQKNLFAKGGGAIESIEGFIFEGIVAAITNATIAGKGASFDFSNFSKDSKDRLEALFGDRGILNLIKGDAKRTYDKTTLTSLTKSGSLGKKLIDDLNSGIIDDGSVSYLASGGTAFKPKGTDTVPAMLTPGEFVINKRSAQSIGYGNLGRMNHMAKGGVAAKGNVMQYFAKGSGDLPTGPSFANLVKAFDILEQRVEATTRAYLDGDRSFDQMIEEVGRLRAKISTVQGKMIEHSGMAYTMKSETKNAIPEVMKKSSTQAVLEAARGGKGAATVVTENKKEEDAREKSVEKMNKFVEGLGSATAAVGGITAAIAGFDLENPMASLVSLGFAASSAAQALTAFGLGESIDKLKNNLLDIELPEFLGGKKSTPTGGFAGRTPRDFARREKNRFKLLRRNARSALKNPLQTGVVTGGRAASSAFATARAGGAGRLGAASKGLQAFSKSLKGIPRLLQGAFSGLPGILASLLVGPLVGAVSGSVRKGIFGEKESIAGVEGVQGFADTGRGGAFLAGGLEAAGSAAGKGIAAAAVSAMIPPLAPFAPIIGATVASLEVLKGAFTGAAAQFEFNAFKDMTKAVRESTKQLERFNKLEIIGSASLANLNKSTEGVIQRFGTIQDASFKRERADQLFSFSGQFGRGGFVDRGLSLGPAAGALGGTGVGAGIGGGVGFGAGAAAGAAAGALGSSWSGPFALVGAGIGALIGGLVGLGVSMSATDQNIEALNTSFERASKTITPEFMEHLDESFKKSTAHLINSFAVLDEDLIKEMSAIQTVAQDLNVSDQANITSIAFEKMSGSLNSATGESAKFVAELNKLSATRIKVGIIQGIEREASLLGEIGAGKLKESFVKIREELEREIDEAIQTGDTSKVFKTIESMKADEDAKKALAGVVRERLNEDTAMKQSMATQKAMALAAHKARRAIDALAAGMDQLSSSTRAVATSAERTSQELQEEFGQITGQRTVGTLETFNPFENVTAATDPQIDAIIDQLGSFAATPTEGDETFRDMGNMVKAQRDFPLILRNTIDELQSEAAANNQETVDNQVVFDRLLRNLKEDTNVEFSPQTLTAIKETLNQGVQRQGEKEVFTMTSLEEMLKETGDVNRVLGEVTSKTTEKLAEVVNSLGALKDASLELARTEQKIAQRKLQFELETLNKQEDIRNRIDKALGRNPDSFQRATKELEKRLRTLARGGSDEDLGSIDVLDPTVLQQRLTDLDRQRAKVVASGREIAQGIAQDGTEPNAQTNSLIAELQENTSEEARLNSQINGTIEALRELSKDTRTLAAIESKIAEAQARRQTAEQGLDELIDLSAQFRRREISTEEFNRQVIDPFNRMRRAFTEGETLSPLEAADTLKHLNTGMGRAFFAMAVDEVAALPDEEKRRQGLVGPRGNIFDRQQIEERMRSNLRTNTGDAFGAVLGQAEPTLQSNIFNPIVDSIDTQNATIDAGAMVLDRVGDIQIAAIDAIKQRELRLLDEVMHQAHVGFQLAVENFQSAVRDFHTFRGGSLSKDKVEELEADRDLKQKNQVRAQKELEAARNKMRALEKDSSATAEAKDQQRITVRDSESALVLANNALDNARQVLRNAHISQGKTPKDKALASMSEEHHIRRWANQRVDNELDYGQFNPGNLFDWHNWLWNPETEGGYDKIKEGVARKRLGKRASELGISHMDPEKLGSMMPASPNPMTWGAEAFLNVLRTVYDPDRLYKSNDKLIKEISKREKAFKQADRDFENPQLSGRRRALQSSPLSDGNRALLNKMYQSQPTRLPPRPRRSPSRDYWDSLNNTKNKTSSVRTIPNIKGLVGILAQVKSEKLFDAISDQEERDIRRQKFAEEFGLDVWKGKGWQEDHPEDAALQNRNRSRPLSPIKRPSTQQQTWWEQEFSSRSPENAEMVRARRESQETGMWPMGQRQTAAQIVEKLADKMGVPRNARMLRATQAAKPALTPQQAKQVEAALAEHDRLSQQLRTPTDTTAPKPQRSVNMSLRAIGETFGEVVEGYLEPRRTEREKNRERLREEAKTAPLHIPSRRDIPEIDVSDSSLLRDLEPRTRALEEARKAFNRANELRNVPDRERLPAGPIGSPVDPADAAKKKTTMRSIPDLQQFTGILAQIQQEPTPKQVPKNNKEAQANIHEILESGAKSIGEILNKSIRDSAISFATKVTDSEMWKIAGGNFAKKAREDLEATDIKINAQMGPITVTLSDNGMLRNLENNLVGRLESIVQNAIQSELGLNSDGAPNMINAR